MNWLSNFDELAALADDDRQYLEQRAQVITIESDQAIFAPGMHPEAFLLVLEGSVVVHQTAANGREIVLYRVGSGESCIMTTACLLSDEEYLAEGRTETKVRAVALARPDFDSLIAGSSVFRRFVFSKYASRVSHLMTVLEDVAFERIDRRLARKLIELAGSLEVIDCTHHTLAVELGSAREVISRQIKEFSRKGWIVASRGQINIVDRAALLTLSQKS